MHITIRADSSVNIGTGHIMRCLTLADFLRSIGYSLSFMTDISLEGNLGDLILSKGYPIYEPFLENIPPATDWLIVDHYALDKEWEEEARAYVRKIMVIDDLANRQHDCDLLLDQNLYLDMDTRYKGKVPEHCKLLLGPCYALLRDEFIIARKNFELKTGPVKRVLVSFGGTDPLNMTEFVLDVIKERRLDADIVMGKNAVHLNKIKQICENHREFNLHIQTNEMAKLMLKSDLAIAAGGTTTWERACLGLPSIVIAIADNQIELTKALAKMGGCFYAGTYADSDLKSRFCELIESCISDPFNLRKQSKWVLDLVDGHGKERVKNCIEKY